MQANGGQPHPKRSPAGLPVSHRACGLSQRLTQNDFCVQSTFYIQLRPHSRWLQARKIRYNIACLRSRSKNPGSSAAFKIMSSIYILLSAYKIGVLARKIYKVARRSARRSHNLACSQGGFIQGGEFRSQQLDFRLYLRVSMTVGRCPPYPLAAE